METDALRGRAYDGFFAASPGTAFFPLDVMDDQAVQIRELMREVRGILDAQAAMLQGVTPEGREELMRQNARMTEKADRMMADTAASAKKTAVPPYARSYELASYLRSALRKMYLTDVSGHRRPRRASATRRARERLRRGGIGILFSAELFSAPESRQKSGGSAGEYLVVAALVPEDRRAFQAHPMGLHVYVEHLVRRGRLGQVDGLRHGVVHVLLEGPLYPQMVEGGHLVGLPEEPVERLAASGRPSISARGGLHVHLYAAEDQPAVRHVVDRLYAARRPCDDAQCAGRGHRGCRGVPLREALLVPYAPLEIGERPRAPPQAPFDATFDSSWMNSIILSPSRFGLGRVVRYAETDEEVGKAHDAEADLPVRPGDRGDLFRGVDARVYHVVEEPHAEVRQAP